MVNKWSDDTPRINKRDVLLEIIPRYEEVCRSWRADLIRQLRRRALDNIHPASGCTRRPQHPNKAPQVTYLSGVLEADLRAIDPADAPPAAAPSIAPGSAEPDGFASPKTPRHGRKVAGGWGQRHVPTADAKLPVCEVQTHGHQEDAVAARAQNMMPYDVSK